jgi:hypothetical protein
MCVYETITNKNIHLKYGIYIIAAVMEKSHNVEEDVDEDEDEAEAKAGPSKTRSSSETITVSATNLTSDLSRTGSIKESHYPRDKSSEDVKEDHEERKHFSTLSSFFKDKCVCMCVHMCAPQKACEPVD